MKKAIVLSSFTMGLGVIRALGKKGVPVVAMYYNDTDMGYVSKYVEEDVKVPHPEEHESPFIDALVKQAGRFGGNLLIPASDASLAVVSRHKRTLEQHYIVACTDWEITQKFIEKKYTYDLAHEIGVPAPRSFALTCEKDVEEHGGKVEFPCLIKPSQSHLFFAKFHKKMIQVATTAEALAVYRQAADANCEVMLQEWIPGPDSNVANYNSYIWDGHPVVEFTAQQLRKAPPKVGSPRVAMSKDIPEIIEPSRRVLLAMGFYGYSCIEIKKDERDGIYKLIEINGRHNLSSMLAVRCGVNFPWIQYQHLAQDNLVGTNDYEKGVYWIDILRDVFYSLRHWAEERCSPTQYLTPYLKRHTFAIFDWRDLRPFVKRLKDQLARRG